MNYKLILNIVGFLLIIVGLFIFTGIPFSIYYESDDITALLISGSVTCLAGLITWLLTRKNETKDFGKREGYIIVTSSWLIMSLFGALPFIIHGSIPNYTDAFFETISVLTTTGG
jgi:trk system potassium uptake protein TrkH